MHENIKEAIIKKQYKTASELNHAEYIKIFDMYKKLINGKVKLIACQEQLEKKHFDERLIEFEDMINKYKDNLESMATTGEILTDLKLNNLEEK